MNIGKSIEYPIYRSINFSLRKLVKQKLINYIDNYTYRLVRRKTSGQIYRSMKYNFINHDIR
jgi:hypothetical protein